MAAVEDHIVIDQFDAESLKRKLANSRFDVIFHLAAYGVSPQERHPGTAFEVNIGGTAAIVDAAAVTGAKAVIYAGSCSEYHNPIPGVLISEDHPLTYEAIYGASKAAAGLWGQAAASHAGIHFQWLRLFGVFGAGEAAHRLIPSIVARLSRDEVVALSAGDQMRDLLHVDDVATGLIMAAEAALDGRTGPFNLCSGRPISVREVAVMVADTLGKSRDLLHFGAIPYRSGENLWMVGRSDKFQAATGFSPKLSLNAGISRMVGSLLGQDS